MKNNPCYAECVVWCVNLELQTQVKPFLRFLEDRFKSKIDFSKYYLSYSGGKDSHFLYWFIKEWMNDTQIEIVGVNTSFEIPEIRDRILRNSDMVLHPIMSRWDIKSQYGIPCFSKQQDEYIHRYQDGSRTENTMNAVLGRNVKFNLNRTARQLLLNGQLHKISNKCCLYNKEMPMSRYGRKAKKKAIIGVRQTESQTRKAKYSSCLKADGGFSPIYDFSDELINGVYEAYGLEIPGCYLYLPRTGCGGCPYSHNIETELSLLPEPQRNSAIKYFKESYDVKGVHYSNLQYTFLPDHNGKGAIIRY